MEFRNLTPFPALAFEGIDPQQQSFQVVVLRQTLTFARGRLQYADAQAPLCTQDEFLGARDASSLRQESDLCAYKPKCDVLVNATAHAPRGQPAPRFSVGLKLTTSSRHTRFEKHLSVCGARVFEKKSDGWTLSAPLPLTQLPLSYESAYGGMCRIEATDPAASRVKPADRLTAEQIAQHLEAARPPVAHTVWAANLVGQGYIEPWYLDARQLKHLAAPQIEHPTYPLSAALFTQLARATPPIDHLALQPAGLGALPKFHPTRRARAGTIDAAFIQSKRALPTDFDFAVWNAAPQDQQTEFLHGDEIITLTNLCAPGTPGSTQDVTGNTVLELTLPRHECSVLARMTSGALLTHPLHIDTVLVEPEHHTLTLVWRTKLTNTALRSVEARLLTFAARDQNQNQAAPARETSHG